MAEWVSTDLPEGADPLDRYHFAGLEIVGEIESPIYTDEEWEEFFEASLAQLNDPS